MDDYALLDSGAGLRLERIGAFRIVRPAPAAAYPRRDPSLWNNPDAEFEPAGASSAGQWRFAPGSEAQVPDVCCFGSLRLALRLTPRGQIGFFPEQRANQAVLEALGAALPNASALNLFAYSGLATLAGLAGGLALCHVDSSRSMVRQARDNAALSGLADRPVRWIEDDVLKFVKREQKRERSYQGFILDPPSYGRGAGSQDVWKIETHLPALLARLAELSQADGGPAFVLLSAHSPGFDGARLRELLGDALEERTTNGLRRGRIRQRPLSIPEEKGGGRALPAGYAALYLREDLEAALRPALQASGWARGIGK